MTRCRPIQSADIAPGAPIWCSISKDQRGPIKALTHRVLAMFSNMWTIESAAEIYRALRRGGSRLIMLPVIEGGKDL